MVISPALLRLGGSTKSESQILNIISFCLVRMKKRTKGEERRADGKKRIINHMKSEKEENKKAC